MSTKRWKVERCLDGSFDEKTRDGDDYAARVFVIYTSSFLPWRTRAICYVWSSREPAGAAYPNPYTGRVATIVLQSGDENAGESWKDVQLILNRYSMTPDPYYATAWFTQDQVGVWNWERFRSEEFDKLHDDAQAELDNDKRSAMYRKAQDLMEDSGAYRFITHEATPVIYRNTVKPALRPDGLPLLRYFGKA